MKWVIDVEGMIKAFWVGTKPTEKDMPVKIETPKIKRPNPESKLVDERHPKIKRDNRYRTINRGRCI